MGDELLCAVADGVATVTLNRPAKRNALNRALLDGLAAAFERLEGDPAVRVVVVRGSGPAFCSGMDLDELARQQAAQADPESSVVAVLRRVEQCRWPTLAVVHGDAFAGGCELALHCDLRVAAEPARFAMPLARLGLVVPFTLGQKLVEIVGPAMTRQILFTGRPWSARRAYEIGMVHEVVPAAEVERVAGELARTIAANAPLSLAGMKQMILRGLAAREGIEHADLDALAARARRSRDAREGVRAMLEKRTPIFRGD
jgi:enoyl-CoA hydratase/carnithine racemase